MLITSGSNYVLNWKSHKPADQLRHVLLPVVCLDVNTAVHNALGIIISKNQFWQGWGGGLFVLEATHVASWEYHLRKRNKEQGVKFKNIFL